MGAQQRRMSIPTLAAYMSLQPWTIQPDTSLSEAWRVMRERSIRHLPVIDGRRVVGIVSERDLQVIEAVPGLDLTQLGVAHIMTEDVYRVNALTPVDEVVAHMARAKVGSVVVEDPDGTLVGIFTTVDALQLYADLVRRVAA
jgi:acetoin utilization protein AcuB